MAWPARSTSPTSRVKLPILPEWDAGLARAAALLLLVVFGVKAALLPLGFWLPETYGVCAGDRSRRCSRS